MADRVDPGMNAMEPPRRKPPADRRSTEPERKQLPARNHTVLPRREPRELLLDESCSHIEHFSSRSGHAPSLTTIASQRTPDLHQFSAAPAAEHARPLPYPSMPLFRNAISVSVTGP
jgi:hypothetical protein